MAAADERELLEKDLAAEQSHGKLKHGFAGFKSQIGIVALLTIVYFGQNVSSYGLSTFMPKIYENILLDEDGKKLDSTLQAARHTVKSKKAEARKTLPANSEALTAELARLDAESKPELDRLSAELKAARSLAKVGSFGSPVPLTSWPFWHALQRHHSDKHGERVWHVAVPLMVLGTCIALVGLTFTNMWLGGALCDFGVGSFTTCTCPRFGRSRRCSSLDRGRLGDWVYQHDWESRWFCRADSRRRISGHEFLDGDADACAVPNCLGSDRIGNQHEETQILNAS